MNSVDECHITENHIKHEQTKASYQQYIFKLNAHIFLPFLYIFNTSILVANNFAYATINKMPYRTTRRHT